MLFISHVDVFVVPVIDAVVKEDNTADDDVIVEFIDDGVSLGVIGPADCGPGVKPG